MRRYRYTGFLLMLLLFGNRWQAHGQEFRVIANRMVISLPVKMSEPALDNFLSRYNLTGIGVKELMLEGNSKFLLEKGWEINRKDDNKGFLISKPLATSADLLKPSDKVIFSAVPTPPDWQQREGDKDIFGMNRFKNGQDFARHDSIIDFVLLGFKKADRVMLAGDFTNWQHGAFPMTKTENGWLVRVKLVPGKYYYKFIVNGDNWYTDPNNLLAENDGQGNTNSVFYVTNHVFRLAGNTAARAVFLSGSFNEWGKNQAALTRSADGWYTAAFLGEGTHAYHYIIDGKSGTDTFQLRSGTVHHFFVKGNKNAKTVTLSGSFNTWKAGGSPMKQTEDGWVLSYALGAGNYRYHIRIDGKDQPDSFLVIGANYTFRLKGFANAGKVCLSGNFANWDPNVLPMRRVGNEWVYALYLTRGKHLYKFVVDGKWILDPANDTWEENEYGTGNSVLWINE